MSVRPYKFASGKESEKTFFSTRHTTFNFLSDIAFFLLFTYIVPCSRSCLFTALFNNNNNSCTQLKPFDGFRCHLAATLAWSNDTWFQVRVPDPEGKGRFSVDETPSQNMQLLPTYENDILCFSFVQRW